jgi:acyl-coenzyme A thioesterase PaaI-like protein
MGTVQDGAIACTAELLHGGRTTQVWDAKVTNEQTGKLLAAFRCTQIILYPRAT